MKLSLLFVPFLTIGLSCYSQIKPFEVRGVLKNNVIQEVGCGVVIVSNEGLVEIEYFNDSTYSKNQIIILFVCQKDFNFPDLIAGKSYRINVSKQQITSYGNNLKNTLPQERYNQILLFNQNNLYQAIDWELINE